MRWEQHLKETGKVSAQDVDRQPDRTFDVRLHEIPYVSDYI